MINEIELGSIVKQSENVTGAEVDDSLVLLNLQRGSYFSLDTMGRSVWRHIENPMGVGALCGTLANEYEGDIAEIEKDVLEFLSEMHERSLISIVADEST